MINFKCLTCDLELGESHKAIEHLKIVHGIENPRGTNELVAHLDGSDWWENHYKWTFGDVQLYEVAIFQRLKEKKHEINGQ